MKDEFFDIEKVPVSITFAKQTTTFPLQFVGIQKEEELRKKVFGEKVEDRYAAQVDLIAELIVGKPDGLEDPEAPSGESLTNSETVRRFFRERTPLKERIAYYTVHGFFLALLPEEARG